MRVSEVFQQAIEEKIQQIKGNYYDGDKGYCAKGLVLHRLPAEDIGRLYDFEAWLLNHYRRKSIIISNDRLGWTWERFLKAALRFEKDTQP